MRLNVLSFFLIAFVFYGTNGLGQRKANFPKTIEHVTQMPSSDSLWIFLMAGQSNMAGRGLVEPQDTVPDRRILTIDKTGKWIYAKEPLHFYEPKNTGLDCGLSFGYTMLDSVPEEISIAIIPCAVGGSSIEQWLEDETFRGVQLLSNFKKKVALAQKAGKIKGVLWHQGESNAKPEGIPKYADNLKKLIKTFREITDNDTLPFLIGQLGPFAEPQEKQHRWDALNKVVYNVAHTDSNTHVIDTQDLKHKGDTLHFDAQSQRKMGRRFAIKYLETTKYNRP